MVARHRGVIVVGYLMQELMLKVDFNDVRSPTNFELQKILCTYTLRHHRQGARVLN